MLFALLLGIAVNFLSQDERCRPGLDFASRSVLRLGVALLGARITLAQVAVARRRRAGAHRRRSDR